MNTLPDLVGRKLWDGSRPLRPFQTETSSSRQWVIADPLHFRFDGYDGLLQMGWIKPWHKRHPMTRRVVARYGWSPHLRWQLMRPVDRYHECQSQHLEGIEDEALLQVTHDLLDPALAFQRSSHVYQLTEEFVAEFRRYLTEYMTSGEGKKYAASFGAAMP